MMVPPRIIRSCDIFPPLVGTQRAARKLALAAAVFPPFRLWTTSLDSMPYFREKEKPFIKWAQQKSRSCPTSVRFSHSATLRQIVELQGALSQHRAPLARW